MEKKKYLRNRKTEEVKCDNCGAVCEKPSTEVKRNKLLNRHLFCSRRCSVTYGNTVCPRKGNLTTLDEARERIKEKHRENPLLSPFNYLLKSMRAKDKEYKVTFEDLLEKWNEQNGRCAYTGIQLELSSYKKTKGILKASVDRIDSNKGYVPGNIQFVLCAVNYMKGTMTDQETKELIELIRQNKP